MSAKKYSAGAIFLQVVPVFADVQRAIEREVEPINSALGDTMEKAGKKAGERAGKAASKSLSDELRKSSGAFERDMHRSVDDINKALDGINIKKLGNGMRSEVAGIKKELSSLKDLDLTIDADLRKFNAKTAEAHGRMLALRDDAKIVFRADIDQALKGFGKIAAAKEAIEDPVEIPVRVDTARAERQMSAFEKSIKKTMDKSAEHIRNSVNPEVRSLGQELERLGKLRVGVDISSDRLKREVEIIQERLRRLSKLSPEIDVRFDSGKAFAELATWTAAVKRADAQKIDVKAKVDTASASSSLFRLTRNGEDASNTFRSFNAVLLAAVAAGPALIPILGAIAGGLLAIGPAAAVGAAGLGSVLVGFSGIGDALTALQAREDQMAGTVAQSARTQQAAASAVADARRNAARAIESALDQQADAQERYRDSIDDVRDAEEALREAREAARGTGDDIKDQIKDNKLAEDQAVLDLFDATVNYDTTMADGAATNVDKEQARIDLETAKRRLEEIREQQKELAKEQKKWRQEGINGVESVESAQDSLNDAIEAQQDAYEALGDAAEAVDQARADGARNVASAMQSQADAMKDISAQQRNVDAAFDKLGPAGKEFSLFLFGLRDDFRDFRDDIQEVMLPSIQDAIESFFGSKSGTVLRDLLVDLGAGFGRFVQALSQSFQGPVWLEFFETLDRIAPDIMEAYGSAFISFLEAFASILTALAPFAVDFAEGLAILAENFNQWAQSKEGQDAITDFMSYVESIAPDVIHFFEVLGAAMINLLIALAPYAAQTLDMLTQVLEFIAGLDTDILGPIAAGIIALITASQVAYGIISLLLAGGALLGSTAGVIIFAVVGIGLALGYLMKTNEEFRDFIIEAWERISAVVMDAWEESIQPALSRLGDAMTQLWHEVLAPFFEWLGPVLLDFIEFAFPKFAKVFGLAARWISFATTRILIPILKTIGPVIRWLLEDVAIPYWSKMIEMWGKVSDAIAWDWNHVIEPVFDFIADTALPKLKGAFQKAVDAISEIWDGLKAVVGSPIKFVLDTIINEGLIDGFNKVAGWVGMDGFKHIPIPDALQSYATGGVMPGYTPGRDPHKFVSPTGGRLELSGGEAVMRPEWTAAVGAGYVNQMNALARQGGVNAIKGAMGFASGGIYSRGEPLFDGEGPRYYRAAYRHNRPFAVDGPSRWDWPYQTGLNDRRSATAFERWVAQHNVPFNPNARIVDYDMRGFWKKTQGRGWSEGSHFPDTYKTPYDTTFSHESKYATRNNPFFWHGDRLIDTRNGQVIFDGGASSRAYWMGGILPLFGARVDPHEGGYSGFAADLNVGSGYDDYGMPVHAWKAGQIAQMNYIGDESYGRWAVLNHLNNQSSLYAHLSRFAAGLHVGDSIGAGQTLGYVGDLGNTGTPPTSHLHFEVNGGGVDFADSSTGGSGRGIPGWIKGLLKSPIGTIKGWATDKWDAASAFVTDSPAFDIVKRVPSELAGGLKDKVMDIMPGWAKAAAGILGKAGDVVGDVAGSIGGAISDGAGAIGGALGLANGGVLPYNGTMKYDAGGYLPPGLTSVVNLTGKPEPVFTNDQWSDMEPESGTVFHYEPHFDGSDLTSGDVAADMDFQFRKMRRQGGKYKAAR